MMISLDKQRIIMYLKIDFLQFNTYNKVITNIFDGGVGGLWKLGKN